MKTIIISALISFTALYFLTDQFMKNMNKEVYKYEQYVGETQVIDKDTLTIVDYSILQDNFTLSNGQKVSYKLVTNAR